ncbi:hypothetical protein KY290_029761 [Solanum tuberosum]|uniref:Uncharacterized protein n=1 Tax=Solanum tuberosum TaxID=4113 RepID=A0ABQ7UM03_SOLTU|nr:hypothetical protein KY290_029761 [Solanum tuberosum]
MKKTPENEFLYVFIAWPIVVVDASHLKSAYTGAFVSANTLDGAANEQLSEVFYTMAKAYTQTDFDKLMKRVEQFDVRVKNYLELVGNVKWARLYTPVPRGLVMMSNIAECINSTLVVARELPIFDFLEQVRLMFARWNCTNRKNASCTFTLLGKKFQEMLVLNESKSGRMTVVPSTDYIYSVSDKGKSYIV